MTFRFVAALALIAGASAHAEPALRDTPYPGTMTLAVDATDTDRAILRVRQTIPVAQAGPLTLRFPEWLPGNHAPRGQIEKLAGLELRANGAKLVWKRDAVDVYAFHVTLPAGARSVEARFDFVSATEGDQGRIVVTPEMINLQWQSVSLYPAGWKTSRIPVIASVTWPRGWAAGTALRAESVSGDSVRYHKVDYETLVDSPVFAGRHFRTETLAPGVALNIVADEAKYLAATPAQIDTHRRLVDQAIKLFGTRPFDHYDFLLALTSRMGGIGLEHHRSSENGVNPEYFTDWDSGPGRRNLLAHEFTHSWNGKHRRPAGQMVGDFKTPLINDLMWVYEGQTQFWGYVLGARSGLFSKQETLDAFASIAATLDTRRGRDWRSLDDTTRDPILTARRPKPWTSWQRSEDYYNEGLLIWLEADGLIRETTRGAKGLDDFAKSFFGTSEGDWSARGYDLSDIVTTLNAIAPYDWTRFFEQRLSEKAAGAPLAGLTRGGYRLIYSDEPTAIFKDGERRASEVNLAYSLGLVIGKGGRVSSVVWDSPAFVAGLTSAAEIIAVNGAVYSDSVIRDAVSAAKGGSAPIRLIVRSGDRVRELALVWNGGHRYPRLEKIAPGDAALDALLHPRP